jgi:hypothetical protein
MATDLEPNDGHFQRITYLAGMQPSEWKTLRSRLPDSWERQSLLRELLLIAGRSPTLLFCLDDYVVIQYEGVIHYRWDPLHNDRSKMRINDKNEIVDPSAMLTTEVLREIFVKIEALVYKCVHIKLKGQASSYRQISETYDSHLNLLVGENILSPADKSLAKELYVTRCEFAHSLKSIDELTFRSKPLKESWRKTGTAGTKRYFLPDVYAFSEILLAVFKPIQAEQIDGAQFIKELRAALAIDTI